MKNAVVAVVVLVVVFVAGFGAGTWYAKPARPVFPKHSSVASEAPTLARPPDLSRTIPTSAEWQEYHSAREKTLHDKPELGAEYKSLLAEINQHQADIEAAMVKTDPKMAQIVAKLAASRERNMAQVLAAMK